MPLITIEGPQLSKEKKRELVGALTKAASGVIQIPEEGFTVIIRENNPDNVGIGGSLLSEMKFK
ncbi:MAG: 4-oxalocrotonate tautomerase [Firmicutes bacterium]|nr:4-oxalocrotonate tautomerase [Bacillota bacterium]